MRMKQLKKAEDIRDALERYNDSATRKLTDRVESLELYAKKLFQYAENYVMLENGAEIGFVSFYANDMINRSAYLAIIAVDVKYQKKGNGGRALQFIINECRAKRMINLRLEVDVINDSAVSFYKRHGFTIVNEASDASVIMEREV